MQLWLSRKVRVNAEPNFLGFRSNE